MEPRIPNLELDNQLCFALYDASRSVVRAYGPLLDDLGLTYPQYITMLVLWEAEGPLSMGDLGDRLRLDSGTLTPLVKRLVLLGVVERRRDPVDERRVLVSLTERGAAMRKSACDIPARIAGRFGLDSDSAGALHGDLVRLTQTMEDPPISTDPPG